MVKTLVIAEAQWESTEGFEREGAWSLWQLRRDGQFGKGRNGS